MNKVITTTTNLDTKVSNQTTQSIQKTLTITLLAFFVILLMNQTNAYEGGSGIEGDPYVINYIEQLNDVRNNLNAHFVLNRSLDFQDDNSYQDPINKATYTTNQGWAPIGTGSIGNRFSGVFDGANNNISNLYINRAFSYQGLFGYLEGGSIKNISLLNVNITASGFLGGLVGQMISSSVVIDSSSSGIISGTSSTIGGLVGRMESSSVVRRCFSSGVVSSTSTDIGGLVGITSGTGTSVFDSFSNVSVSGSSRIGGLVGRLLSSSVVRQSFSYGFVSGSSEVGGLVGQSVSSNVYDSFWDYETSGRSNSAGGFGLSTSDMKSGMFWSDVGFDIVFLDGLDVNNGYIFLSNQIDYEGSVWVSPVEFRPVFNGGDGSEFNPFVINYLEQLNFMRLFLNGFFVLNRSLDFNDDASYQNPLNKAIYTTNQGWEPIGTIVAGNRFTGDFDGAGYNISNLYINRASNYQGLFGYLEGGSIKNLSLLNVNITGANYVGGLVGQIISSNVVNGSSSSGVVTGSGSNVGGLVGSMLSSSVVNGSSSSGVVTGSGSSGGLVGSSSASSVFDSFSIGVVNGTTSSGGLVGNIGSSSVVQRCFSYGFVNGSSNVGGLVGQMVTSSVVNDSYSGSVVSGSSSNVGGLVGNMISSSVVRQSFSYGFVNGSSSVGGLVGASSASNVYGSFWNYETSSQSTSAGGFGLSTSDMKSGMFWLDAGFDIVFLDGLDVNNGYIFLSNQIDYEGSVWVSPVELIPIFGEGDGSEFNPFVINNLEQLNFMRLFLNGFFVLNRSLDFNDDASYQNPINKAIYTTNQGWEPIGTVVAGNRFTGGFDGAGYNISNLYINRASNYQSLFGYLEGGSIKNISLFNVNISSNSYVGGLVSYMISSVVSDSSSSGIVSGLAYVGGLVGTMISSSVVNGSSSSGVVDAISSTSQAGGLVGYMQDSSLVDSFSSSSVNGLNEVGGLVGRIASSSVMSGSSSSGTITGNAQVGGLIGTMTSNSIVFDSFSSGVVNGSSSSVGGLVGSMASGSDTKVINCFSSSSVSGSSQVGGLVGTMQTSSVVNGSSSSGVVTGSSYTGGLVGYMTGSGTILVDSFSNGYVSGIIQIGGLVGYMTSGSVIRRCFSSGVVSASNSMSEVGGLVGYMTGSGTSVFDSFSNANVIGVSRVGGLVGYMLSSSVVRQSFNYGLVNGSGSNVGGLIGQISSSNVYDSFWDYEASGILTSAGGTSRTTSQMSNIETFENAGWNISSSSIRFNEFAYPYLSWSIGADNFVWSHYDYIRDIILTPEITDYDAMDPGAEVFVNTSIYVGNVNLDYALLQWKNASVSWNDASVINISNSSFFVGDNDLIYLGFNFTLPDYEGDIDFRIYTMNVEANEGYTLDFVIKSYWDCSWVIGNLNELEADYVGFGSNQFVNLFNLTIVNTGDVEHPDCNLLFDMYHNFVNKDQIKFDNRETSVPYSFSVLPKTSYSVVVSSVFYDYVFEDEIKISVSDRYALSDTFRDDVFLLRDFVFNRVSVANSPYLALRFDGLSNSFLLKEQNFNLSPYIRNLLGNEFAAYNVSFNISLPNGFSTSNNLSWFGNLSHSARVYNDLNISFSRQNLEDGLLGPGDIVLELIAQGYNVNGSLIENYIGDAFFKESFNISLICNPLPDNLCVPGCEGTDPDCAPLVIFEEVPVVVGGGGGGGDSNQGLGGMALRDPRFVESEASYLVVRGDDVGFSLHLNNSFDAVLENVSISVSGFLSEFLNLSSYLIERVDINESVNIFVLVNAPSYLSYGSYDVNFIFNGSIVRESISVNNNRRRVDDFIEQRKVVVTILDLPVDDAINYINKIDESNKFLTSEGFNTRLIDDLVFEAYNKFNSLDYQSVRTLSDRVKELQDRAVFSKNLIEDVKNNIDVALSDGLIVVDALRLINLAQSSLDRGDFDVAYERAMDARTTLSLEIAGQFNIFKFIISNWIVVSLSLILFFILLIVSIWFGKLLRVNFNLRLLQREMFVVNGLIREIQKETFARSKSSMDVYLTSLRQYESKLSELVSKSIMFETKKIKLLNPRMNAHDCLVAEKNRVETLLKDTQNDYIGKGRIETRVYENRMRAYISRLADIEGDLANEEAMIAFKRAKHSKISDYYNNLKNNLKKLF